MDSNKMPVPAINPTMKPSSRLNFYPVTLGAAFLFLVCAFPVRASENTPINFNSALALALKSNPSQAGSLARIEEAAAALQTTNAIKRPHLNLEENAARSNNPLTVLGYHLTQQRATFSDFGLGSYSGPSTLDIVPAQLNHPGYAQNFDTGLVITLPLYSGGRNRALIHQAQAMLKAAKEGNIDARNLLTYDLLKAYAGVHTARSSLETAEHASTAAQNEVYSAHQLFRQGLVTQSDILLTESKLSQDQANVKRARSILNNEIDTFRTLLGKPSSHLIPGIPVTLQDPTKKRQISEKQEALSAIPEIARVKAQWQGTLDAIQVAKSKYWPQINLVLRHDWNATTPGFKAPSNTAMLNFSWQIFNFGSRSGSINQSKAAASIAQANYLSILNQFHLQLVEAIRSLHVDQSKLRANLVSRKQTRQATRLLLLRYQQGLSTLTQVLDSQAMADASAYECIQSRYDILLDKARIDFLENTLYLQLSQPKTTRKVNE